ncbi:MAG: adenine phosphoribosyltransferase [Clostridia bacterium]|nr:adenine phosphoribosyltransferase [Clostridia bacterium]
MKTSYEMEIAGLKRALPLCSVTEDLYIAAFIMFGDVEITVACAKELLLKAPEFDVLMTAEAKGIPLVCEMARQAGTNKYIVARKGPKVYMKEVVTVDVNSITTAHAQKLSIDKKDAEYLKGKRVLIIDDVISTGESLAALESLANASGAIIAGKMAVLAEGDAADRDDIIYLERLPLFDKNGEVKE